MLLGTASSDSDVFKYAVTRNPVLGYRQRLELVSSGQDKGKDGSFCVKKKKNILKKLECYRFFSLKTSNFLQPSLVSILNEED